MKVFVCWSGPRSNEIAKCVRQLVADVNQHFDVQISNNLPKTHAWLDSLSTALEESAAGLLCFVKENLRSPWLQFETGALSVAGANRAICPLLFGVEQNDLTDTVRHRQTTSFTAVEYRQLLQELNAMLEPPHRLQDGALFERFESAWPRFEQGVNDTLKRVSPMPVYLDSINAMRTELEKATRFNEPVFQDLIGQALLRSVRETQRWAAGEIEVSQLAYPDVLLKLYETAAEAVFSTSIAKYLHVWKQNLGDDILAAHQRNPGVAVHRVFIFENWTDIETDAINIMQKQNRRGIKVSVWVNSDKHPIAFPASISPDFTIVDGPRAIGVTTEFQEIPQAKWYFECDALYKTEFKNYAYALRAGSIDLENALARLETCTEGK